MTFLRYWLRLSKLFFHYRIHSKKLSYRPVRLWIELSSDCNYKCVMCPNKDLENEERGFMDGHLYRKIIDESSGFVFEVNLAHRGESLLHPQIIDSILYAKSKNLFTRLHTNGSLLTEELSKKLISSGLDRLSFSFDGYDKQTYEKIRVGGDFEKTISNIVRFLEIKKELGSKSPETAIEVINFSKEKSGKSTNEDTIINFKNRFRNLPLDSFVLKDLHNWAGELKQNTGKNKYSICPFPWNALVVCWDGSVIPCTQDFFNENIVGNVSNKSLFEIWNNEKMMSLRKNLTLGNIEGYKACSHCDRPWRERIFGVPKENLWKFITKRMP